MLCYVSDPSRTRFQAVAQYPRIKEVSGSYSFTYYSNIFRGLSAELSTQILSVGPKKPRRSSRQRGNSQPRVHLMPFARNPNNSLLLTILSQLQRILLHPRIYKEFLQFWKTLLLQLQYLKKLFRNLPCVCRQVPVFYLHVVWRRLPTNLIEKASLDVSEVWCPLGTAKETACQIVPEPECCARPVFDKLEFGPKQAMLI